MAEVRTGRDVVAYIDRRWREAQRVGRIHPWERSRILAGDYTPILRELEPDFAIGGKYILSWSRSRRHADPDTGQVFCPPPEPRFLIEITAKDRKAHGGWAVRFDIYDRRDPQRLPRRLPPVYSHDLMVVDQQKEPDPEDTREESAYTTDPRAAVDSAASVDDASLEEFRIDAEIKRALGDGELVEQQLARIKCLPSRQRMAALHKLASDRGIDVRSDVKAFERRLLRRLGKAA